MLHILQVYINKIMSILNQKEQVVDIQLTSYGRKMLGLGLFQPKYHYFYDDSIIYDYSYFNEIEDTNAVVPRILNESLTFSNINTSDYLLNSPLGSCKLINDYCPAWDLRLLNGHIEYNEPNSNFYKKIFEFDDIIYTISIDKKDNNLKIHSDFILIDLQELNLDDDMKNFEIEVVTYDELNGGKLGELERKLRFLPRKSNIINNIIYDESELPTKFFEIKLDESYVGYYLDVLVDDEIDKEYIVPKDIEPRLAEEGLYSSRYIGPVDPKC